MDTKSVIGLVDQLADDLDDLDENLEPLLLEPLLNTTKKLPLLDRAKLNVFLVYAIESLIFSYLRVNGVQAKEHSVFRELTRVKQYFEKIKEAEAGPLAPQPTLTLDKAAAGRFIKNALAGNDKYDLERREREAREKLLAKRKLKTLEAVMKEKAEANNQEDADADASALAAAEDAAKLIAMDLEEGEISDDSMSLSDSSDSDEEPNSSAQFPHGTSSTSSLAVPEAGSTNQDQASLAKPHTPSSSSAESAKKGQKRKQTPAAKDAEAKRQKRAAKNQRNKAKRESKAAVAAGVKTGKKANKAKKAKKGNAGAQKG